MSITIHYNGTLDDRARLPELLDAARLYCAEQRWLYRDVDERILGRVERAVEMEETKGADAAAETQMFPIDDSLTGILITVHRESEPVWLTFNDAGELVYYMPLNGEDEYWELKPLFTKTQYAGSQTHIAICELFHLLQDNYFPNLHVYDESGYFEAADAQNLERAFVDLDSGLDSFREAPENSDSGETDAEAPAEAIASAPTVDRPAHKKSRSTNPKWKRGHGSSASKN